MSGHSGPKNVKQFAGQISKELIKRQLAAPVKVVPKPIDKVDH